MRSAETHQWYFVCDRCGAKVFAATTVIACPRCKSLMESREMLTVTWRNRSMRNSPPPKETAQTERSLDDCLLRTVAYALRHGPHRFFLDMDAEGWVKLDHLLLAIRHERREWAEIDLKYLWRVVRSNSGTRFEVRGRRIRALYGHSVADVGGFTPALPPTLLYHGTSRANAERIVRRELHPMGRNYVHLTTDWTYAYAVAASKSQPVVLSVRARAAAAFGVDFWRSNEHVWLSNAIPEKFVSWE